MSCRNCLVVLLLVSLNALVTLSVAGEKIVTVSTLEDYAPFCMKTGDIAKNIQVIPVGHDAEGFEGYSWDVLRESFHEMGYTILLSVAPWKRAMQNVQTGKVDILFPTGKNRARQEVFNYSVESVNLANYVVYVRADSNIEWRGLESLKGLTIGVKSGFNYGDKWKANTGVIKHDVTTILQGFKMLDAKRFDGFIGYEYNWDYILVKKDWVNQFRKLPAFESSAEYLVARKGDSKGNEALKAYDTGKKRLIESGKLALIKKKWFGR